VTARKSAGKRPASPLRAALAARTSLRTYHDIAVAPGEDIERAQRQLEAARQMHAATLLHDDEAIRARAAEVLDSAERALGECFHRIYFRGLDLNDFDALVSLHPPTAEEASEGKAWSDDLVYALLAAVVENEDGTSGGLTDIEWKAELNEPGKWPAPERQHLVRMAWAAQRQTMADAVPKG
jgi:hypothetical protein